MHNTKERWFLFYEICEIFESSYNIHIYKIAEIFGDHFFLQILVEEYSDFLVFPFFILFPIPSVYITGVLCCVSSIFSGHITF